MADEIKGSVFDLEIVPTVNMASIDELEERLNKLDEWNGKNIQIEPEISKDTQNSWYDAIQDFQDFVDSITVPIKVNIQGDIKQLTKDLSGLKKLLDDPTFLKIEAGASAPQVAKKPASTTKPQESKNTVKTTTDYSDDSYYAKELISALKEVSNEYTTTLNRFLKRVESFNSEFQDPKEFRSANPLVKTKESNGLAVNANDYAKDMVMISNEILKTYQQSVKANDDSAENIRKMLAEIGETPETLKETIAKKIDENANKLKSIAKIGGDNGAYTKSQVDRVLSRQFNGSKGVSQKYEILRDSRTEDLKLSARIASPPKPIRTDDIKSAVIENVARMISENTQAVKDNTAVEKNDTIEDSKVLSGASDNSGGNKGSNLKAALEKMISAIKRTNDTVNRLAEKIDQFVNAEINNQNERLAESYAMSEDKIGTDVESPLNKPNNDTGWTAAEYKLIGNAIINIQGNISGIKEFLTNSPHGGGTPTPQTPNPSPTPRKPANPQLPNRNAGQMLNEVEGILPDVQQEIKELQFLISSTGGIEDSLLSDKDAQDLLSKLEAIRDKLIQVDNIATRKNPSVKALTDADTFLTEADKEYSNIQIPGFVSNYYDMFNLDSSVYNAEQALEKLTALRDELNNAHVDTSAYDDAIKKISDSIEKVKSTEEYWLSQKLDASGLKAAEDAIDNVNDSLRNVIKSVDTLTSHSENEYSDILSFKNEVSEIDKLEKKLTELDRVIKKAKREGVDLSSVTLGNGQTLADAESTIARYFSEKDSIGNYTPSQFTSETEFKNYRNDVITNLVEPIKVYADTLNETKYAVDQLIDENNKLAKSAKEYNQDLSFKTKISSRISSLETWGDLNSKALSIPENAAKYANFMDQLRNGLITSDAELRQFNSEFAAFNTEIVLAGKNGKTTGSILTAMFKKFGGWTLVTRTITQGIRLMKDMVTQVKEVDTAMVNLRKVTDASEQSLLKYQKTVQKSSIALGTSLTDQIDSTAIFSRLGYQLDEAEKLGEIASKYKTVAEDLDINTASESIISTMKAYQSMGDTAEEIVDKFNYVGNNFAVSSSGLGESLQRSASSLVAANNTLSEAIALTTAGNEIIQDPEKMGTSLKTISARIRGAKSELEEEGEEMTMTVSKLRDEIKSISGVEIMLDEHSFRSTYDILNDLSKVWKDLNDTDQARIGEMLGGKVGINTVYAMLENFETARDVVKELNEGMAEGSADRELETALDSIQGKLNQIQSVWQTLSTNVVDSELVKDGLDWVVKFGEGLNDILDVLKDMKGLGTGLLAFGGMTALQAQLKNKTGSGRVKMFALDKYARVSSGGNTERVRTVLVCGKRALEKLPKLAHCVTSFMNLVREGWLRYRLIRSQAYLVGRFREYNGRAARVVMGYSRQLRERSKIIRSDSLLRWKKAINIV